MTATSPNRNYSSRRIKSVRFIAERIAKEVLLDANSSSMIFRRRFHHSEFHHGKTTAISILRLFSTTSTFVHSGHTVKSLQRQAEFLKKSRESVDVNGSSIFMEKKSTILRNLKKNEAGNTSYFAQLRFCSVLNDKLFLLSRIAAILEISNKSLKWTNSETRRRNSINFGNLIVGKKNFFLEITLQISIRANSK
ncbi:unnamed protein product [Caenorhabditis auriculariae]|uniref:Uncharacterized protein n=1 Tax=Caenorhabditis auriculariae TaxID=2777116 RepID=A0A8S1HMB2_9PELO|nr:unnamed protein product [Caenorhabditis auriculariae]